VGEPESLSGVTCREGPADAAVGLPLPMSIGPARLLSGVKEKEPVMAPVFGGGMYPGVIAGEGFGIGTDAVELVDGASGGGLLLVKAA
jgi:hypothetical protein